MSLHFPPLPAETAKCASGPEYEAEAKPDSGAAPKRPSWTQPSRWGGYAQEGRCWTAKLDGPLAPCYHAQGFTRLTLAVGSTRGELPLAREFSG